MWSIIITVVLQVVSFILNKIQASAETKQKFFEFVRLAANDSNSTKLMQWGEEQVKQLQELNWDDSKAE